MARPPGSPVFFDVDGVLLDSLPQHLAMCRDKAREYGLTLDVPDVQQFRRMVASGVKVSPMLDFFLAVGFPPRLAAQAVDAYESEFARRYRPVMFPGIGAMLQRLKIAGHRLGLVTSNIAANVEPPLRDVMANFDRRCLFYIDRYDPPRSKTWCLLEGARVLGARPQDCVFVGDQPADAAAARDGGWDFLGVSYGWGLPADDPAAQIVDTPAQIADAILGP
jgi:phosphoglycolate phosphatase-like HAD superfamily hydrolase